jgi:hypothetical protein
VTAPHPSPTPAGSVLDGDPRILIPLPEAAAEPVNLGGTGHAGNC